MSHQRWIAAAFACAATHLLAQEPVPRSLTLGDAARLGARQSVMSVEAYYRAEAARGRARESRSALLPQVSATFADGQRTFNTASFGLPLPGFDPNGQIIGPVRTIDARGRVVANLLDPAAFGRYRRDRKSVV